MNPSLTISYSGDFALAYAKDFSDAFVSHIGNGFYFVHIFIRKLSVTMIASVTYLESLFVDTIQKIVAGASKPQVIGINTGRIVTSMANVHSIWNWIRLMHSPRKVSGACVFAINYHESISGRLAASDPQPTSILKFFNTLPESFFWRIFSPSTQHHCFKMFLHD